MKLFLCEKPSQAREIAPHVGARKRGQGCLVGDGVTVTWAIGHLVELATPEHYEPRLRSWDITLLPVLPADWALIAKDSTKDQFAAVSKLIRSASEIVIATDADREGEVIARELMQINGYQGRVSRLWLSAFDDASIKKALGKLMPGEKTLTMYHSGMGRGRADWLAGMNLTMALTKAFGAGGKEGTLHCGRVQTPVLALIVRRERAILNFTPVTHYQLSAHFDLSGQAVSMTWLPNASLLDKDGLVLERSNVEAIASAVSGSTGRVVSVETRKERELAPLPYSLGSLQREATARFGMKAQAVLDAAQGLYEKHKATTYPRTDCEYLPGSMVGEAGVVMEAMSKANPELREAIGAARTALVRPFTGRAFNDGKITAHHAIIPTQHPGVDRGAMSKEERIVYDMVCRRYLAQFLGDFQFLKTTILVECAGERFRVSGKTPTDQGWRSLEPERPKKPADGEEVEPVSLPAVAEGQAARNLKCELVVRKTTPPKRYTEGTLLAAMESIDKEIEDPRWKAVMKNKEKAGIGTDATRSAIIEGLFRREYIEVAGKKDLCPTQKGMGLIELIEQVAPEVADPVLTAHWEDVLGQIEKGEFGLTQFEQNLGAWLQKLVGEIRSKAGTIKVSGIKSAAGSRTSPLQVAGATPDALVACSACGAPMRRLKGKTGFFWGCSAYQNGCRNTMNDVDGKPVERAQRPAAQATSDDPGFPCPKCQKPLRRINGTRGPFWGCTGYPACNHTLPDEDGRPGIKPDEVQGRTARQDIPRSTKPASKTARAGVACPECGDGLLINKTVRDSGKPFVGCNRFPTCRFFAWPDNS